jgi:hypothetical protein
MTMDERLEFGDSLRAADSRRTFLKRTSQGLGIAALASLLNEGPSADAAPPTDGLGEGLELRPRAKRVICLFMSGGPSHVDLFDAKPTLRRMHGQPLPASVRGQERLTLMTRNQKEHLCFGPVRE